MYVSICIPQYQPSLIALALSHSLHTVTYQWVHSGDDGFTLTFVVLVVIQRRWRIWIRIHTPYLELERFHPSNIHRPSSWQCNSWTITIPFLQFESRHIHAYVFNARITSPIPCSNPWTQADAYHLRLYDELYMYIQECWTHDENVKTRSA